MFVGDGAGLVGIEAVQQQSALALRKIFLELHSERVTSGAGMCLSPGRQYPLKTISRSISSHQLRMAASLAYSSSTSRSTSLVFSGESFLKLVLDEGEIAVFEVSRHQVFDELRKKIDVLFDSS